MSVLVSSFILIISLFNLVFFSSEAFCNSSPCLNGGTCIVDPQYSFCQCVAPWNGVFCNLRKSNLILYIFIDTCFAF
jgi:hypothetical protein